ncbi:hypothetical protein [Sulfitobacter donghicola]|nr:hypothetical protein [Sulfitobacter donghicola]
MFDGHGLVPRIEKILVVLDSDERIHSVLCQSPATNSSRFFPFYKKQLGRRPIGVLFLAGLLWGANIGL